MCVEKLESKSFLESFVAPKLIPPDKKPGLRSIGVGEVLRGIAVKAVMMLFKNGVIHAAGALELSTGHDAGVETAVHAMRDIFSGENTEAVFANGCRKRFKFDQSKGNASQYEICISINLHLYMYLLCRNSKALHFWWE